MAAQLARIFQGILGQPADDAEAQAQAQAQAQAANAAPTSSEFTLQRRGGSRLIAVVLRA